MHPLNAHESEQTPGGGEGLGSLVLGSPWGRRLGQDSATEQQELIYKVVLVSLYSKVIQLYICIHSFKIIFLYGLSQDVEYGFLVLRSRTLLFNHHIYKYKSLHLLIPNYQSTLPPALCLAALHAFCPLKNKNGYRCYQIFSWRGKITPSPSKICSKLPNATYKELKGFTA